MVRFVGQLGDENDNQVSVALPAEVVDDVPDEAKSETAVVTINEPVPSKTTDVSKPCDMVGGATALVTPGRIYVDFTHLGRIHTRARNSSSRGCR